MGPLHELRILEIGGRGPVRFSGMLLADLGAEVISIHRPRPVDDITPLGDIGLGRGRRKVSLDLRTPEGRQAALAIASHSDAVIEGFLPGVTEKLGLGPAECMATNPRLVYGRITGWGQTGPLANQPGHDINFLAVSGVLSLLGRAGALPAPPMNLLADGGGAMLLTLGVTAAVLEARSSGVGQTVDASMLDSDALLSTMTHEMRNEGRWVDHRGSNLNDSGAPFYDVYPTADRRLIAVGAVEEQYWNCLLTVLGIPDTGPDRWDRATWPLWRGRLATAVSQRTQSEWCSHPGAASACISPVLTPAEAADHPQNQARRNFTRIGTSLIPSPAPQFSRTALRSLHHTWGTDQTSQVLGELGIDATGILGE
ncbi:CaiB/BaiF CoA transferase family protein [Nocardia nova]|uniref:CoA transferase n=1 Tax=Nocardia nova TaxID=37330 RepID=A0A2S6A293_9NOCA|nr:CaiB/BaiF CoA-transferase family protein [Nocardia nova]PPJ25691.1 CoA transferase [Nocardia nova]